MCPALSRLRTHGVNTNGAAAKALFFEQIGEQGTPWHFLEDNGKLNGSTQKGPSDETNIIPGNPISAEPISPFPTID